MRKELPSGILPRAEDEVGRIENVENHWSSRCLLPFQKEVLPLSSGSIASSKQIKLRAGNWYCYWPRKEPEENQ
jgi:hypothetical protein